MSKDMLLTSTRLKMTRFQVKGLYNEPIGNSLVNMRVPIKHMNISTGLLQFISKLNQSQLQFKKAVNIYSVFKRTEDFKQRKIGKQLGIGM